MSPSLPVPLAATTSLLRSLTDLLPYLPPVLVRPVQQRNTALDCLFYDVGNLTEAEREWLTVQSVREGSILVVEPGGSPSGMGVEKFEDHAALRAEPGPLLRRFTIAGVGSSDLGAAAFARTIADRYREPVGAIVAGYGVADLMAEGLGGWFYFGQANRVLELVHKAEDTWRGEQVAAAAPAKGETVAVAKAEAAIAGRDDAEALFKLLLDDDRTILSVAGHSKGCLSIAFALEALAMARKPRAVERAKRMRIVTVGAVIELPRGYANVGQYLGAVDWFGAMNSRIHVEHERVPGAWHHLNTKVPMHLDFAGVLAGEPD